MFGTALQNAPQSAASTDGAQKRIVDDERGVSLIELIIVVALLGIVFAGISAVLMGIIGAQKSATGISRASTQGDAVATALDRALRSAQAVDITADGSTLRLRTSLGGDAACQGFAVVDGGLSVQQSAGELGAPADWTPWLTGVDPDDSGAFAQEGARIRYSLRLSDESSTLMIASAIKPRSLSGGGTPCW